MPHHEVPELIRHDEELEDRRPAPESAPEALGAAFAGRCLGAAEVLEIREIFVRPAADPGRPLIQRTHLPARGADRPGQPLGEDGVHRAGHQIRLDAEIEETRRRGRRVVRMEGREDEVAGQRGLDRDRGRFEIPDLAHHDDVGILADDRPEPLCKRQPLLDRNLGLGHARELVLDRVFQRQDVELGGIERG